MLDLNKRLKDAKLEHEKTLLQRQIEATDAAIDALVYELYGLTEEEDQNRGRNRCEITPSHRMAAFL